MGRQTFEISGTNTVTAGWRASKQENTPELALCAPWRVLRGDQKWKTRPAFGANRIRKPNRFGLLGGQDSGHRILAKTGIMLAEVGVNAGLVSVAEIARDRARPLGPFKDTHRGRMAHGMAMDHLLVESRQLGVFLDDYVEIVPGQSAEQHRCAAFLGKVDYLSQIANRVSRF